MYESECVRDVDLNKSTTLSSSGMALTLSSTFKLSSGQSLPILGLGVFQSVGDECVKACLAAFRAGYRHIDTAVYYRNEDQVGEAVRQSGLEREEIFITSKIVTQYHGYENTLKAVEASLTRFGFDYIDLFLIHDPYSGKEKRLESYKALLELRNAGKIRSVGVSNYGVHHLEEIKAAGFEPPAVDQIELHPWCQQRPIVDYCRRNSIVIEAYTPLTRGRHLNNRTLQDLGRKHNRDAAQILIRWSLQKGFSPLPKSSNPLRIVSNAQVYDFELPDEDIAALDGLDRGAAGAVTWNPVEAS